MSAYRLLSSITAMLGGVSRVLGRKARPPKEPKKYRKESEQERRERQAKRGAK